MNEYSVQCVQCGAWHEVQGVLCDTCDFQEYVLSMEKWAKQQRLQQFRTAHRRSVMKRKRKYATRKTQVK